MCGIIGYLGSQPVREILVQSLRRLEYRGYDSCGVGLFYDGNSKVVRAVGGIENLERKLNGDVFANSGVNCGIGHTRWATHGQPIETNAHPHRDCSGRFLVVHNGIIENYLDLKRKLDAQGHVFRTQTDSEVLPHLIESHFNGDLEEAVLAAVAEIEGAYALLATGVGNGPELVAARRGAPLVVGCGPQEYFVASDSACLLPYTRRMIFLNDGEVAAVRPGGLQLRGPSGPLSREPQVVPWTVEMAQKNGHPHFMLKEIFEQPRAIRDTLHGRLDRLGNVVLDGELPLNGTSRTFNRVLMVACGSSLHAAHVGRLAMETLTKIPVQVDYASEFRYRQPLAGPDTLLIAISQSGETADTLAAAEEGRRLGARIVAITNVEGSSLSRMADWSLATRAGPEIGVASTKAFTAQLVVLNLLALFLAGLRRSICPEEARRIGLLFSQAPFHVERALEIAAATAPLARQLGGAEKFLYLGRGACHPIAMEGALKLKEISYVYAEGLPAGEMKHGPIALVHPGMPVVVIAPRGHVYKKTLGNIEEVKGRGAAILAIGTERDTVLAELADHVVYIPDADPMLDPLLATIPLQLFAYHVAAFRGCNVDKPRNLAKTVTVE